MPGYGPPPGGPPPKKGSKAPIVIAVVAVLVLVLGGAAAFAAKTISDNNKEKKEQEEREEKLRQEQAEREEAQEDLSKALIKGDTKAVADVVDDHPELIDATRTLEQGETAEVRLSDHGVAAVDVKAQTGEPFTVTATSPGDQEIGGVVLDPKAAYVSSIAEPIDPEQSGKYTVLLFSKDGKKGKASVTVGGYSSESMSVGDKAYGSIDNAGDVVDFQVDLESGGRYTVTLDSEDFALSATDSEGQPVSLNDQGSGEYQLDATSTGTHHLRVVAAEDGGTGSFSISVVQVPDFTVTNLVDGAELSVPFTYAFSAADLAAGQYGRFKVTVRSGVTIRINVSSDSSLADFDLAIREEGEDDVVYDDAGPGGDEETEYTAEGFSALEVQVEINNFEPATLTVTIETV